MFSDLIMRTKISSCEVQQQNMATTGTVMKGSKAWSRLDYHDIKKRAALRQNLPLEDVIPG
jgi:hypothetical protein